MVDERNKKKGKFIEEKKNGFEFKKVYVIPLLIAAAVLLFVLAGSWNETPKNLNVTSEKTPVINAGSGNSGTGKTDSDTTIIPVSKVDDGKAHFYNYESSSGVTIRFFVLKSSDGVFRAAFDACDVCYSAKKGYRQEGDYMVCNNCGNKFPSTKINEEKGGCNPASLDRTIDGGNIVIKNADIEKGVRFF